MKVVIPSYGSPVKALFAAEQVSRTWSGEIIIVDDTGVYSKEDAEARKRMWLSGTVNIEKVKVLLNLSNMGFASAVNTGIEEASQDVVLVNSDVIVSNDAIGLMKQVAQEWPKAGVIGAKLLYPDGSVQHAGMTGPEAHGGFYHVGRDVIDHTPETDTDRFPCVTGALMFVRFEAWQEVGGFDQEYHNNAEDVDFCWAVRAAGWQVVYSPRVKAIHIERATLGYNDLASQMAQHGLKRFHFKWFTEKEKGHG